MIRQNDKYAIHWLIGRGLSFILYFSGLLWLYLLLRKNILKSTKNIILTFHSVGENTHNPEIIVSTKSFERQMEYLSRDFQVISLKSMLNNIATGRRSSRDSLAITFDDGYKDNFQNAAPILDKYNFTATFFLVGNLVGRPGMLSREDVRIMRQRGFTFASHTLDHAVLSKIDTARAQEEIISSKRILQELTGGEISFFAYPKGKRGDFNQQVKNMVRQAGYQAALTTENGALSRESDLFALPRIGIRECPLFVFKVRVSGILESRLFYPLRKMFRLT